jgi:hypothetical protein
LHRNDFIKKRITINKLLKYILEFFFIFIILTSYSNCKEFLQTNGETIQLEKDFSITKNSFKSYNLNINDTFDIEGTLVSTIVPDLSAIYHNNNTEEKKMDNVLQSINPTNDEIDSGKTIEQELFANINNTVNQPSLSQQMTTPITNPSLPNLTDIESNGSDNISDNLVSVLSGILIESIQNGNPTINEEDEDSPLDPNMENNKEIILLSGKWKMEVHDGNITNFDSKYVMITSNGTGFHWHTINNLKTNEKLFLGNDDSAAIRSKLDFVSGSNTTKKTSEVLLSINNLELIQFTIFDKEISSHLHGYPIYGIIDSIKIKN